MSEREMALARVLAERRRQDEKWGEQSHSDEWWLAILQEEVGEVAKAMVEAHFARGNPQKIGEELVQACAVALQWIECMERRAIVNPLERPPLELRE